MITYTPTQEEIIELGFYQENASWAKKIYQTNTLIFFTYDPENGWSLGRSVIYPRSREHLESIILAFTPN